MTTVAPTTQSQHDDACQCCGIVGPDRRTLLMGCFVEMLSTTPTKDMPLTHVEAILPDGLPPKSLYTMVVCKACRGAWLEAVWQWWQNKEAERRRNAPQDIGALLQERYDGAYQAFRASTDESDTREALGQGAEVLTIARALGHKVRLHLGFPANHRVSL